jgi:TRAP-type mannitol/chloroaromatic compound transport system substrate-binding protein
MKFSEEMAIAMMQAMAAAAIDMAAKYERAAENAVKQARETPPAAPDAKG